MTVIEKINEINDVIKEVFAFTQSNETIRNDFQEYLATIGARDISLNQMEKVFLPYIFERRIAEQSIMEMFKEVAKNKEATEENATDKLAAFIMSFPNWLIKCIIR